MIGLRNIKKFALAAFVCLLLLVPTAAAMTVSEVIRLITPREYRHVHTNLFVNDGHNRGFTGDLDANIPRVPAFQHDAARDYIKSRLESFGLETRLDPFWFTRTYGSATYVYTNCNNVIAVQYGTASNAGWHIVGAHYDTVDTGQFLENSPGADDNASGTAAVLELARVLSGFRFRDHIIYIAFDAEEKGLKGAWHFVDAHTTGDVTDTNRIQRSDVRGMISLDMLAYNPGGSDWNKTRIYGGSPSSSAPIQVALKHALTNYTPIAVYPSGHIAASDHHPFHVRGMDACLLIEYAVWSNPHYHKETDSIDTPGYIDYDYATELTRGVAAYLCEQAGIILPATLQMPVFCADIGTVLSWSAQSGAVYRVEYTDILTGNVNWQTLGVLTNSLGREFLTVTNRFEDLGRRFYRVENIYEH